MDRLKVLVACGAYLFVGPTLIVLNKVILNELHFAFPMTLASLGNVASFLVCTALVHTGVVDLKNKAEVDRSFFLKKIMPIGAMSAGTLFFGNKVWLFRSGPEGKLAIATLHTDRDPPLQVYLYLTVAFIQILKAFTPVVTMVVMFVAGLETPGLRLVLSVLGLAVGTSIAAYGELHFSLTGVLIMLSSEVAEAIKLVLQQILLRNLKFSVFESLYWISPASLLVMVLVIYAMEWQAMQDANAMDIVRSYPWHFMGSALLGFAVNTVSFFVIQVTSAVTLKVLLTSNPHPPCCH